jgi:RHS repeat-associated protein
VAGSAIEVVHTDRLGSVRTVTDDTGAVIATTRTDEFGIVTATSGFDSLAFGFTGEPVDGAGLVYLRARHYDPTLGRFLTRDTWAGITALPGSLHRYAYVQNSPATHRDPSGHILPLVAAIAIGAAIGGLVGGGGYVATTMATGGSLDPLEGAVATAGGAIAGGACVITLGACVAASVGASVAQYTVSPGEKDLLGFATSVAIGSLAGRIGYTPRFRPTVNRPTPNPITLPRSMQGIAWANELVFSGLVNLGRTVLSTAVSAAPSLGDISLAAASSSVKAGNGAPAR